MAPSQHPLTPLEEALESWEGIRAGLRAEVENVPAERFDFRPAPDARSVAELVRHVLEVGLMMVGELCRPDTDLQRAPFPDLVGRYDGPVRGLSGKRSRPWPRPWRRDGGASASSARTASSR